MIVDNESDKDKHVLYCSTILILHTHLHKFFHCT